MNESIFVFRFVLGAIFLTAGFSKMWSLSDFENAIQHYGMGLINLKFARFIALLLLPMEIIIGGLFIIGLWPRFVALCSIGSLMAFTILTLINIFNGNRFKCNCFGKMSSEIGFGLLTRNIILISICLFLFITTPWFLPLNVLFINLNHFSVTDLAASLVGAVGLYIFLIAIGEVDVLFRLGKA